ncbi:hypothetical protein [Streptomyces bugieae]|uniref:Uncharacterized protein n=1 Tax=Streptomyces bugieae TaxID=3098223 RepID=A0ABU7NHQ6_9ACTN|nr:hypothetical protein [Streptomyces sp. DSM 41528]
MWGGSDGAGSGGDGGQGAYAPDAREDIAYVCDQLDRIRATLEAYGTDGAAPLERLLAALRAGGDLGPPLDVLHEALLAAGDAAGVNGRARGLTPLGITSPAPDEWVLLCPAGLCARHAWPDRGEPPRCRISDRPLRRERL